ncbi:MAG: hypothetical protein V7603_3521 [Micromonosporaceae bacterium]
MPRQKNLKRLVRGRMAKTGESYTAARSMVVDAAPASAAASDPEAVALARAMSGALSVTGLALSAELLFGVAGGIGFQYLVFAYPEITTVSVEQRFNALYFERRNAVQTAGARLGVPVQIRPTENRERFDRQLRQALATAAEVAVTLEDATLPRLVAVAYAGGDGDGDTQVTVHGLPRGRVTMAWDELVDARWTHGRKYGGLYVFGPPTSPPDVGAATLAAIGRTAECLLEPNRGTNYDGSFGVPGMRRFARLLVDERDRGGWPRRFTDAAAVREALDAVARGLSGSTRRRYAAFLEQAAHLVGRPGLGALGEAYRGLDAQWSELARVARRTDATPADLAGLLPDLAEAEQRAATALRAEAAR